MTCGFRISLFKIAVSTAPTSTETFFSCAHCKLLRAGIFMFISYIYLLRKVPIDRIK